MKSCDTGYIQYGPKDMRTLQGLQHGNIQFKKIVKQLAAAETWAS